MKQLSEIGLGPLPWRWTGACTVSNAHYDAVDGTTCETRVCFTENEAVAHFIVHAPRLYQELLEAHKVLGMPLDENVSMLCETPEFREMCRNLRASIEEALQLASGEKKGYVGTMK